MWVNLHFFAIIGPVLLVAAGVGHLLEAAASSKRPRSVSTREQAARLILAVGIAAAACAVTPYGPIVAAKAVAVHDDAAGLIVEWRPAGFGTYSQFTAVLALLAAIVAAIHAFRHRRWDTVGVIVVLSMGTAAACRTAPVLVLFVLPELAAAVTPSLRRALIRRGTAVIVGLFALVAIGIGFTGAASVGRLDPANASPGLIAELRGRAVSSTTTRSAARWCSSAQMSRSPLTAEPTSTGDRGFWRTRRC